ncbi:C6 transcription factor [Xylariaceae sp. FL1651]|nr:C6 transcription factor [Xylariaceae sp. FL1651]
MTLRTGKRSYRACLRCRRRKTKCNLDGIGEPKRAPCLSCHESGSECVLVESKRGGNFRSRQPKARTVQYLEDDLRKGDETLGAFSASSTSESDEAARPGYCTSIYGDQDERQSADECLLMQLRNPSDALQILARSSDNIPYGRSNLRQPLSTARSTPNLHINASVFGISVPTNITDKHISRNPRHKGPYTAVLDDYDLIHKGLLRLDEVLELLLKFSQDYHPYCPIVPSYLLKPSVTENLQRSDYFLLTVILTIASRDSPKHYLTNRYCWDHTQHLLLEVLLAHPWSLTPRTVEGILLLSEWLPHIQVKQTASQMPKTLFSEDSTAWSLVGLAVRQGYLLRLDQAVFQHANSESAKHEEERKRLIWTFIYLMDRQISVRLGQSFWSRGPSLSSPFTAKDFPSIRPGPNMGGDDYASVLQATLELTQILHNAHAILYSSKTRTLTMIYDGDYSRYLDDFQRAATNWHASWNNIQVSHKIKTVLLLMYEYTCLYVNAFSFQAALTRMSTPQPSAQSQQRTSKRALADLFACGILSCPDGRYVYDAISAAMNLLNLMNGLDPQRVLCYLPSRYHLYGVYASVFLYKAESTGAFHSAAQRQEVIDLVLHFITSMEEAASVETHICHGYSRMLRQLWHRRNTKHGLLRDSSSSPNSTDQNNPKYGLRTENAAESNNSQPPPSSVPHRDDQVNPAWVWDNSGDVGSRFLPDSLEQGDFTLTFPSIEEYLLQSFLPGITDVMQPRDFGNDGPEPQYSSDLEFPEVGHGQNRMDFQSSF